MEQTIMRQAILDTYVYSTASLVFIWLGTMLSIYRYKTLGYVNKRERYSRHEREKYSPSHNKLDCDICNKVVDNSRPLCECFGDFMCDYHALPKGGA